MFRRPNFQASVHILLLRLKQLLHHASSTAASEAADARARTKPPQQQLNASGSMPPFAQEQQQQQQQHHHHQQQQQGHNNAQAPPPKAHQTHTPSALQGALLPKAHTASPPAMLLLTPQQLSNVLEGLQHVKSFRWVHLGFCPIIQLSKALRWQLSNVLEVLQRVKSFRCVLTICLLSWRMPNCSCPMCCRACSMACPVGGFLKYVHFIVCVLAFVQCALRPAACQVFEVGPWLLFIAVLNPLTLMFVFAFVPCVCLCPMCLCLCWRAFSMLSPSGGSLVAKLAFDFCDT